MRKGVRQVHKILHGNSHEHISLAPTISAAGSYIPSLIIYKGYMHEELFQMYINHFINSISSIRPVLLILDGHKSHINYISVDFCCQNEYSKSCDRYSNNNNGMIVKKHTFAKVFGPAFLETYTPLAICNTYKATRIWPFNPNAISPDQLDPSLTTEQFNYSEQSAELILAFRLSYQPNPIKLNVKKLYDENIKLKNENKLLKEKLDTYKNPEICNLCLAFKYPVSRNVQANNFQEPSKNQLEIPDFPLLPPKKKRKILSFARLLTNEETAEKKAAQKLNLAQTLEKRQKKAQLKNKK
ncbi:18465_t:CDS:2 [Funneliformis geosporum]|uniref:18465_t:CDS:1 n=1 Tax=Funneliformis geosporum TaxID=1117311 RepID=A0A9W4T370_9GLOM|nr:18465_t:CDS:2 [Funneliformis geosporum]